MIFNRHISQTLSAIQAVSIATHGRMRWNGVPVKVCAADTPGRRSIVIDQLTALLYAQFYCYGRVTPIPLSNGNSREALPTARFVAKLVASNHAAERWEEGWHVVAKTGDRLLVERKGLRMTVARDSWRLDSEQAEAGIRFPLGSFALSPGAYLISSNIPLAASEIVRIYWNTTPQGAVDLMRALTTSLEREAIPYQFKVFTDLTRYDRADASVLYLQQNDFAQSAELLGRIYQSVQPQLRREVPIYTQELAPGLGLAEQPPGGESFGQHRCRLLAEGLILASEAGRRSKAERLLCAIDQFARHGLSFEHPYLNPGSEREYSISIKSVPRRAGSRGMPQLNGAACLELATRIGHELVRKAIWHRGACNWIGDLTGLRHSFGALGPELYSGTSGIGWFLAELFRATGSEEFRHTAEGALRQACGAATGLGKGLYAGLTGIAYAAWRSSFLLDRPALRRQAGRVLIRLKGMATTDPVAADVISGEAGAILALLMLGDDSSRLLAERYGRVLIKSAERSRGGWSWQTINPPGYPHLTGFSHGTAGIASAFLSLYARTGRSEFRTAAEGALNYERACFNEVEGNWPDFRGVRSRSHTSPCASAWCHGAPGIALSRTLAAGLLDSKDEREAELAVALEATRAALKERLMPDSDFSLCHGLAGNADILRLVGQESDRELVLEVGLFGLEHYGSGSWPRGATTESLPGLMTGMAGIGHFYLRFYDSHIPSPLWLGPTPKPMAESRN